MTAAAAAALGGLRLTRASQARSQPSSVSGKRSWAFSPPIRVRMMTAKTGPPFFSGSHCQPIVGKRPSTSGTGISPYSSCGRKAGIAGA